MANNRLYIEDTESGERLFVAKHFGAGWDWIALPEEITNWMKCKDPSSHGDPNTTKSSFKFVTENEDIRFY